MATEDPTGWREFIENVINGSNYFRASEYMRLLNDMESNVLRIRELESENAALRHDLQRSMANHVADLNPPPTGKP